MRQACVAVYCSCQWLRLQKQRGTRSTYDSIDMDRRFDNHVLNPPYTRIVRSRRFKTSSGTLKCRNNMMDIQSNLGHHRFNWSCAGASEFTHYVSLWRNARTSSYQNSSGQWHVIVAWRIWMMGCRTLLVAVDCCCIHCHSEQDVQIHCQNPTY